MKMMNIKKLIARILIVAMILTSQGFYTFADSIDASGNPMEASTANPLNYVDKGDSTDANLVSPGENTFGDKLTSTSSEASEDEEDGENFGDKTSEDEPEEDGEETTTTVEETTIEEETTTTEGETTTEEETTTTEGETTTEEETTTTEGETTTEEETTTNDTTTTTEVTTTEVVKAEEASTSEIEIIVLEEVSTKSNVVVEEEFFGAGTSTITLEFGDGKPFYGDSSNWNIITGVTTPTSHSVSFTGSENATISEFFASQGYAGTSLNTIINTHDGEDHIVLPTFGDILTDYQFDGWYDSGDNLVTELPYKFGNTDLTYTARWRKTRSTITLEFGENQPFYSNSSNWNVMTGATLITEHAMSFTAPVDATISEFFASEGYAGTSLNTLINHHDDKDFINLPRFNSIWTAFNFSGWYDETDTAFTELPHKFGSEDLKLTAKWTRRNDYSYTIYTKYVYSTYSSVWDPTSTNPTQIVTRTIADSASSYNRHGASVNFATRRLQGFKIATASVGYNTYVDIHTDVDLGPNGMLTRNFSGTGYFAFNSEKLEFADDYSAISGIMPNHSMYITYYCELDREFTSTFSVKYTDALYTEIDTGISRLVNFVDVVESNDIKNIPGYSYLYSIVSDAADDGTRGILKLGTFHTAGEIYKTLDVYNNNGRFKAVMPNQNVTVTHIYSADVTKITLDFGAYRPMVDRTSNWNNTSFAANPTQTIEIQRPNETVVVASYFDILMPSPTYDLSGIKQSHGSGQHIIMPTFSETTWTGFEFAGWYDENGDEAQKYNGKQELSYAFPYVGDEVYTAKWNRKKEPGVTYPFSVKFYRATNPTIWPGQGPYNPGVADANYEIADAISESYPHGTRSAVSPVEIPGYKITSYKIRTSPTGADVGSDGLKVLSPTGTFVPFDSDDMVISNLDYSLSGMMPNHPLYIEYYYEPDESAKNNITILYYNEAGSQIRAADEKSYKIEDIVTCSPKTIPSYTLLRAEVGASSAMPTAHIFALGDLHTLDEKYTSDAVNAAGGAFKAVMPNQPISITYVYKLEGSNTEVFIQTEKQNDNDEYVITTTSTIVKIGSPAQVVYIDHLESQGYGRPNITFQNVMTNGETPYNYNSPEPDAAGRGKLYYHVDTDEVPIIFIRYGYDRTNTDYWTKLGFNYKLPAEGGKGTITNAPNTKLLSERYVRRDNPNYHYTLNDLISGVTVTPDPYYMVKWKNGVNSSGTDIPTTGNIPINDATYDLFADFVEDPSQWIDITFTASENSSLSGTTSLHIPKDTSVTSPLVTFPTVIPTTGYHHEVDPVTTRNIWLDTNGNPLGDTFDATKTYKPYIVANFTGSNDAVKPVLHLTYNSNGTAKANLFGTYGNRYYVLADRNDKVLKVCTAVQSINGFDNLTPGTTYHMYESKNDVAVGSVIATALPNISDPYVFGVRALQTAPTMSENANDTYTISTAEKTGISYALLDDRYNIVNDWTTNPIFGNLTKGTYYLLVAKSTSDNIAANDDNAIRNGYVVYTSSNDLTGRNYKLVFFGTGNVSGAGTGTALAAGGMVYTVPAGNTVRINGANGYTTFVLSNNVTHNAASTIPYPKGIEFTMPEEDVIINRIQLADTVPKPSAPTINVSNTITVNTDGKISVLNIDGIRTTLNSDPTISAAIDSDCEVKHYVEIRRYATNKAAVQGLNNGYVSPYEYTIDVQSVVLGVPFRASTAGGMNLKSYLAFDSEMLNNPEFKLDDGSVPNIYDVTESKEIGSFEFYLDMDDPRYVSYLRKHSVHIESNQTAGGISYAGDFVLGDGAKLTSDAVFNTLVTDRFKNLFDNAASDANKKEYIFNGLFEGTNQFDYNTKGVNKSKNLTIKYTLNQDREDAKTALSEEIVSAVGKLGNLTNATVIETLNNAIAVARDVRNTQNVKTVAQLVEAKNTLKNAKDAAVDPALPGETVTVTIDANGGEVNTNAINVITGDNNKFDALESVEATRSEYNFVSWNTLSDGTGTTITKDTVVGLAPPTILYAIWEEIPAPPTPGPSPRPRPSGGGGGGGGGGGIVREQVITDKQYAVLPQLSIDQLMVSGYTVQVPVALNALYMEENANTGFYGEYDPITNALTVKIGDKVNKTPAKDRWVEMLLPSGDKRIYRTDAEGKLVTGKYLANNGQMYYLANTNDMNQGMLAFGWIRDPLNGYWYYSSVQTGSLATGWQIVDNKYYYFYKPIDDKGNVLTKDMNAFVSQYGMMMSDTQTMTGEILGDTGAMVTATPYLAQ